MQLNRIMNTGRSLNSPAFKKNNGSNDFLIKTQSGLSQRKSDYHLTFGWSKCVAPKSPLEKILNSLVDRSVKSALVITHASVDGDAIGSAVGIAGILSKFGVTVCAVADDYPQERFKNMPSPIIKVSADKYVIKPDKALQYMNKMNIKNPDLAIITDSAIPDMLKDFNKENNALKLASKAKKILIIDHHPDREKDHSNLAIWQEELKKLGISPDRIIYWREDRASASEMVAEIDKEIMDELKTGGLKRFCAPYVLYRLAVACGIYADTGAVQDKKGKVRLGRLSAEKIKDSNAGLISKTRYYFNWLIANCANKGQKINFDSAVNLNMPEDIRSKLNKILAGEIQASGIHVKKPDNKEPFGYLYIENYDFIDKLIDDTNKRHSIKGKSNNNIRLSRSVIYKELKESAQKLHNNENAALMFIISKLNNAENLGKFSGSIRSYGYENVYGELHNEKHLVAEGLAQKIMQELKDKGIASGNGHDNACGISSLAEKDFLKDALPIIKNLIDSEMKKGNIKAFTKLSQ